MEQGADRCRAAAGFGVPAAEEPDRVIPGTGPAGPALPFPGRATTSGSNPARYRPSGSRSCRIEDGTANPPIRG